MLGKLLKYDLRRVSPILLVIHAALLFFSFLSFVIMHMLGVRPFDNVFTGIYATTILLAASVISVFTTIYLGISYYRSFYSDEGYLTNTLPVKTNRLVFSKFLCGTIWTFLDYLIVISSVFILLNQEVLTFYQTIKSKLPVGTVMICGIVIITEIFTSSLMVYCAAAIGSFFHGHRIMGCVGGYILLYLINQILAFLITLPMFINPAFSLSGVDENTVPVKEILAWINRTMGFAVSMNLVLGIIYYLICQYTLNKRLEMD